jgi:hypothetical protein
MGENPCPSPPFLLLGDILQEIRFVDSTGFQTVECQRKEAYGCGPNGDAIVRGLSLFVRLGREDDPYKNPKLCFSATDEVLERVGSEIDDRRAELYGRHIRISACICTVDGNVMVLRVSFVASFSRADFRSYLLVYDSAAASLVLLSRRPTCTFPIPLKVLGEDRHPLVLMAKDRWTPDICLWSLPDICLSPIMPRTSMLTLCALTCAAAALSASSATDVWPSR